MNYCRTLDSIDVCKEILECTGKFTFESKDAECITQHWGYAVVTHRTVLETAGAFLSDKSGKKCQKPTSRTQDGQLIQQLLSKKKLSIDCSKAKPFTIIFSIIAN